MFADGPKLSGPEGQHAIQASSRRGPMRIWCGSASPSARCCTRVEAIPNMSPDWELNSSKAALWEGLGPWVSVKPNGGVCRSQESQMHCGLPQKEMWLADWGRWLSRSALLRPHFEVQCPALESSAQKTCRPVGVGPRKATKMFSSWSISPMQVGWELGLLSLVKRRLHVDL